jgi:vacuolar-type H+-ATPase catalytic subunit A/Vma1
VDKDGGAPCSAVFEYGTTTACNGGTKPVPGSFGSGMEAVAQLTGLEANRTYYYRLVASHPGVPGQLSRGEVKSFVACPEEREDGTVWVAPVSSSSDQHDYQGTTYQWETPGAAYDDWDASAARCYHMIHDEELWSPYLYLTPKQPGLYSGLRFKAARPDGYVDRIQIEIRKSTGWEMVHDGPFQHSEFEVKSFELYPIMDCRVRFHMSTAGVGAYWSLYEFDFLQAGINVVASMLPYYLEERPGLIMSKGRPETISFKFGPEVIVATEGVVTIDFDARFKVFEDAECTCQIKIGDDPHVRFSMNLADSAQKKAFLDGFYNRSYYIRADDQSSDAPYDSPVKCALTLAGTTVEDKVLCTVATLDLVGTPEFLFADAKYATTIRFSIAPSGLKGYTLRCMSAVLRAGETELARYTDIFGVRVVGLNLAGELCRRSEAYATGYGIYEFYVPSSTWKDIVVPNNVCAAKLDVTVHLDQGPHDVELNSENGGQIPFFADKMVPAADIPVHVEGSTTPEPKRPLGANSAIDVQPVRRCEGVKDFSLTIALHDRKIIYEPVDTTGTINGRPYWNWAMQPTAVERTIKDNGLEIDVPKFIFSEVSMRSIPHHSSATIRQIKDSIAVAYHPVVCAKNYGKREGVWMNVSYGGKNTGVVGEVLGPGETAMDYMKTRGILDMGLMNGEAVIDVEVKDTPDLAGPFGSVAKSVNSIFAMLLAPPEAAVLKGVTEVVGLAQKIYSLTDTFEKPTDARGGRAKLTPYYAVIHPKQPAGDKIDQVITTFAKYNDYEDVVTIELPPSYSVVTGSQVHVYYDMTTWVQQTSDGYWDGWGATPPSCISEIWMCEGDGLDQRYYILREER